MARQTLQRSGAAAAVLNCRQQSFSIDVGCGVFGRLSTFVRFFTVDVHHIQPVEVLLNLTEGHAQLERSFDCVRSFEKRVGLLKEQFGDFMTHRLGLFERTMTASWEYDDPKNSTQFNSIGNVNCQKVGYILDLERLDLWFIAACVSSAN